MPAGSCRRDLRQVAYLREIAEREAWMLDRHGTAILLNESFAASVAALAGGLS
jgi:hypothetical protein